MSKPRGKGQSDGARERHPERETEKGQGGRESVRKSKHKGL